MNIVNKLTLRHLKENKGRTVITTLGICVSVAMITAVFVAMASFLNLFGEIDQIAGGHRQAVLGVTASQLADLKNDDRLERVGVSLDNPSYQLENRKSNSAGTGEIYIGDKMNLEQMFTGNFEGAIPEKNNEIAVEQSLIDKNKLDWKIGDTVFIPIGDRYYIENGEKVILAGSYFGDEEFEVTEIGEFKITAILHDNPATSARAKIIRGLDLSALTLADGELASAYIEVKNLNYKSLQTIKDIIEDYKIEEYNIDDDYLATYFAIDSNSATMQTFLPLVAIILVIIMIASVVLIYNSFGMSLSERVRYLGMLASVGATKQQKKMSVYYEGFILGIIGIPVGIGAGILGIGITLKAVGGKIIETGMIQGIDSKSMDMNVVAPLWAIAGIIIFSVLTIFISSVVPSRKASAVTPIDAIRQRKEITVKAKGLKSPKIIRKIFGYEGELAYKNLKRNGRKGRVITASIALSVILFFSCNYFCDMFTMSANLESMPFQVTATVSYDHKDEFLEKLEDVSDIDNYYCVNNAFFTVSSDENSGLRNKDYLNSNYGKFFNQKRNLFINMIDDKDFNKLCEDNNIDYKKYYGSEIKGVVLNNVNHKNDSKPFSDKMLGYTFDNSEYKVKFADFIKYDAKNNLLNINPVDSISVYIPLTSYYNNYVKNSPDNSLLYMLGIETKAHEQVADSIQEIFDSNEFGSKYVADYTENMKTMNTVAFVLQVFVYGFIALITLITIANIINTVSTGIAMRRKEFAMLKSVGTTPQGFRKMVVLESAFYGMKALVFALPISAGICFALNYTVGSNSIPFEIDWIMTLCVIAVVFAVVGTSMLYSVSKLRNDNIVETLKEEIN